MSTDRRQVKDGRPIVGPGYSYHGTPPGSTVDLDPPDGYREIVLGGVFCLLSGRGKASGTEINEVIDTVADVIRKVDRHCGSTHVPESHVRHYLDWLAGHGPALPTEGPQVVPADLHGPTRRELLKRGWARWLERGLTLTAVGQAALRPAGGVTLAGVDECE